jgi:DnaK suppressor protein
MTPTQLVKLTLMLEVRLEELSNRLRNHENITVERTPDVLDDIELSVERDLTILSLDKGFAQLRHVTAALDRIAAGTYGCCLRCDEEVNMKRLTAMPHASFCIKCQEVAEHDESREGDVLKKLTAIQVGV